VGVGEFNRRPERLAACMRYNTGLGFLVIKLSGLKMRCTDFRLKKVAAASENLSFSGAVSNYIALGPGRYAVVPYTSLPLSKSTEYALHFNYLSSQIEFEIEDVLSQRLQDDHASDEDEDEEYQPADEDLLDLHEYDDEVSLLALEQVRVDDEDEADEYDSDVQEDSLAVRMRIEKAMPKVLPPRILQYPPWEYLEDAEERGVQCVYGEAGDVFKYVRNLQGEVRKLQVGVCVCVCVCGVWCVVCRIHVPVFP
jgi:hypothetical protein